MTIAEAIETGAARLREEAIPDPEREASLLLRLALKRDAAFVYAHPEYRLNAVEAILFKAVVKRRAEREPYQYIAGTQEFYGLDFAVTPDVLIPRPETEILVEAAIKELKEVDAPKFCEIGVGSGCIAVSILANAQNAKAVGVDVSEKALAVARANAESNGVADRLDLRISNIFENVLEEDFDAVISNPPYVPTPDIEGLPSEVRLFEPHTALDGGIDGLDIVRNIVNDSSKYLKPYGLLFLEIGWNQSGKVKAMLSENVWQEINFLPDLQGISRIVAAKLAPGS